MRVFLSLVAILAATAGAAPPAPSKKTSGAVIREEGAIYLEDLVPKPVRLTLAADAPIFYKGDLARYLGTLRKGATVELQAVADRAYRVRGQAQQGQVAGWIEPRFLSALKPEFLASLRQNAARQAEVGAMIERGEVAINMTPEEVVQSLGKPGKKSAKVTAEGRDEVWEFVRYERVPQQTTGYDRAGQLVSQTVLVKVPVGKLAVRFRDNLVTALEQTEGTLDRDARVKIVAAPFAVVF